MISEILLPILFLLTGFSGNQLYPGIIDYGGSFELRGYTNNDMAVFSNIATPKERFSKGYMKVGIGFNIAGWLETNIAMQGWIGEKSFNQGHGGGIWGAKIHLTEGVTLNYEHFSCHSFDTTIPNSTCGSRDHFGIEFKFGYKNNKDNLLRKLQ